jgi:uncharacterized phiE125 gp8 family phage protein
MIDDRYELATPPTGLPVSLTEVKAWLKITHTSEDTLLTALLNSAISKAELFTNRVFLERTYKGYFSALDCSCFEVGLFITLRRSPVQSVTSVKVYSNDVLETIDTEDYDLKIQDGFSRIVFSLLEYSPDVMPFPYEVVFVAGYGDAADVPAPIKLAIQMMVAYWYQNRGDCGAGDEIPGTAKAILREYRIINTFGVD